MLPGQAPAVGASHEWALLCVGPQTAVAAIRAGGRLVTVGMGCDHARLPVSDMTFREVTLAGSFRYANTVRACHTPDALPACVPIEKRQSAAHALSSATRALCLLDFRHMAERLPQRWCLFAKRADCRPGAGAASSESLRCLQTDAAFLRTRYQLGRRTAALGPGQRACQQRGKLVVCQGSGLLIIQPHPSLSPRSPLHLTWQ